MGIAQVERSSVATRLLVVVILDVFLVNYLVNQEYNQLEVFFRFSLFSAQLTDQLLKNELAHIYAFFFFAFQLQCNDASVLRAAAVVCVNFHK